MEEIARMISQAIFTGTCVFVPVLFILHIFEVKPPLLLNSTLILAVNYTLLLGSLIFIAEMFIKIPIQYYSAGEYGRYTIANRFFGPFWIYFWLLGPGPQWLLPQILWIRKFRSSIICSAMIVCIWVIMFTAVLFLTMHLESSFSVRITLNIYLDIVIYAVIISIVYIIVNRKVNRVKS